MGIPVGDVLRSFVNPNSFLGRILAKLKGVKITTKGGTEILLDERQGATPPRTGLDRPAKFEPPKIGRGPFVLLLAALLSSPACDTSSGPTAPPVEPPAAAATPAPAGPVTPTATPVAGRTVVIDGGRIEITTPASLDFKVCVYEVKADGQTLAHESQRKTAPVGTTSYTVPTPSCAYQIDVIDWRQCPVSGNPPVFGGGLIQGYLSGGTPCPSPTPTPKPTPSPTPSPTPTPTPSPSPTPPPCTEWAKVTATATSQESGEWSIYADSTLLWKGRLNKGQSHAEAIDANGAILRLKYGGKTYATAPAVCPQVGKACSGTLVVTCGCK